MIITTKSCVPGDPSIAARIAEQSTSRVRDRKAPAERESEARRPDPSFDSQAKWTSGV